VLNKLIHSAVLIVVIQTLSGISGALSAQNSIDKVLQVNQFTEDFEAAWRFIHNNYAWFDDKLTDWNRVYGHLLPLAQKSRTETEFIRVLEQLLEQLYDHHAHLGVNTSASPRMVPSGTDIWAEFQDDKIFITSVRGDSGAEHNGVRAGMEILSVGGVPAKLAVENRIPVTIDEPDPEVLDWALQTTIAGTHDKPVQIEVRSGDQIRKVEFQPGLHNQTENLLATNILDGNTGYIQIHNSLGNMDLIREWDRALEELQDTDALILDMRNTPGGGNSTVARGIMSRLISEAKPYQIHEFPAEERKFGVKRIWTEQVSPRGPFTYTKPVAVLVNRWTGSMGEGIAIGLDGMARATVIGTPMAGLKGALYSHTLPNTGIEIRIPAERLYHIDGMPRELYIPPVLINPENQRMQDPIAVAIELLQ
jgi:carboxyl-terminal processing protease